MNYFFLFYFYLLLRCLFVVVVGVVVEVIVIIVHRSSCMSARPCVYVNALTFSFISYAHHHENRFLFVSMKLNGAATLFSSLHFLS